MKLRSAAATTVLAAALAALIAGCSATTPPGGSPNQAPNPPAGGRVGVPGGANGAVPAPTGVAGPDSAKLPEFTAEVDPREDPQATFALDVDTASYAYARALINQGQLPPPNTVRPEEYINSFNGGYPQPAGDGFTVNLDGARLPSGHEPSGGGGEMRLLRVGLQTLAQDYLNRPDAALTFVIDVSGSMGDPGKLDLVKDALHTLVDQLRTSDSVAIVTFNTRARVERKMTSVTQRSALHSSISELSAGGSTNLGAGLVTGYQIAREGFRAGITNRVILLSDGLANTGDTQAQPILAQVREEAAKQITLLGVGVGNDYGDALMEQLADSGDGYVVYVSTKDQARQIFVTRLPATLTIRALDAKAQVTFNPTTVAGYRLIGYDNRALADTSFRNDRVDGGEVFAGHSVTALFMIRLRPGAFGHVAQARVRWLDPGTREASEASDSVSALELGVSFVDASARLQVCYTAAFFAEVLRHSQYGQEVSLDALATIAARAGERTDDDAVIELAALIRAAARLD